MALSANGKYTEERTMYWVLTQSQKGSFLGEQWNLHQRTGRMYLKKSHCCCYQAEPAWAFLPKCVLMASHTHQGSKKKFITHIMKLHWGITQDPKQSQVGLRVGREGELAWSFIIVDGRLEWGFPCVGYDLGGWGLLVPKEHQAFLSVFLGMGAEWEWRILGFESY